MMRFASIGRVAAVLAVVSAMACISVTDGGAAAVDVRGEWNYAGTQAAPAADLTGTLTIGVQDGELVGGSASWEERTTQGMTTVMSGALSGRVIGTSDVDFDVLLSSGTRRHVARLTADTLRGTWAKTDGTLAGEFTAIRVER